MVDDVIRVSDDVLGPFLNLLEVGVGLLAGVDITEAVLDDLDGLSDGIDDLGGLKALELIDDVLDLLDNIVDIVDASGDLGEVVALNKTFEEADDDLDEGIRCLEEEHFVVDNEVAEGAERILERLEVQRRRAIVEGRVDALLHLGENKHLVEHFYY